jgi:hypothetical protein
MKDPTAIQKPALLVSVRRKRTQGGQEFMEFALIFGLILAPLFLSMIIFGMNLIVSNQVNFFCREVGSLFISGADLTQPGYQTSLSYLAAGLNLQVGTTGGKANTGNSGSGIVTVTQIKYVGTSAQTTCTGVSSCNTNSFVYMQRIQFGNGSLATAPVSLAGTPSGVTTNPQGVVANPYGDANAKLTGTAQTGMKSLWNAGNTGGLQDGQAVNLVETYFESTGFSFGSGTHGIFAKFFF